jgi:hypothetical protein
MNATVSVQFTAAQLERLTEAASLVGKVTRRKISVADMIVAGALSSLDWSASCLKDASGAVVVDVQNYVKGRATFAYPEHGTHNALQSACMT